MRLSLISMCLCLLSFLKADAQNLYDLSSSKEFANYLFHSQQYPLAAIELERLLFLEPSNDSLKITLVKSYTFNKEYSTALHRLDVFYPQLQSIHAPFDDLYAYNLLADKKNTQARSYLSGNQTLTQEKKHYYQAFSYMLEQDFKHSNELLLSAPADELSLAPLRSLSDEGIHMRCKSPGLALAMSAVVPGTGKFYTGDWKDGIVSMISIGLTTYQAVKGFRTKGTDSAYGWIYGTLATGFYLGNIYGSFTSAKRYNKRQAAKLAQKVDAAFYIRP